MKLVREHIILEKFIQDSDPVADLGIGLPELVKMNRVYSELKKYVNGEDLENLNFKEVKNLLKSLLDISIILVIYYFSNRYGIKIEEIKVYNRGGASAIGTMRNYIVRFDRTSTGSDVFVSIVSRSSSTPWKRISAGGQSMKTLVKNFEKRCKEAGVKLTIKK